MTNNHIVLSVCCTVEQLGTKKQKRQVATGKCSAKAIREELTAGMGDVDETQVRQSITGREGEVISKPDCKNKNKTTQEKTRLPVLQALLGESFKKA